MLSNWMRELLHISPVLYLFHFQFSVFFFRIRKRCKLAALVRRLSFWLSPLCFWCFNSCAVIPRTAVHPSTRDASSSSYLLPLSLSPLPPSPCSLFLCHEPCPWAYSFHWQFLLGWEGYVLDTLALDCILRLYSFRVSVAVGPFHRAACSHTHTDTVAMTEAGSNELGMWGWSVRLHRMYAGTGFQNTHKCWFLHPLHTVTHSLLTYTHITTELSHTQKDQSQQ